MSNMLNTRIRLKYDTFENWSKDSAKTLVLLEGELAIVSIPDGNTQEVNSVTAPQILFKVGDGVTQFQYLPWASAKAADVYAWAKQPSLSINKDGTGNVVSGIEWDATANNGKGGIKFTTAAVATSEGLQGVQDRLAALEAEMGDVANDYANSRIDVLEKTISDNQANWAKDDDTTYTFEEIKDENERVTGIKVTPKGGNAQPISFDFLTEERLDSILYPTYEGEDDWLYLNKVQVDDLAAHNQIKFTDDGDETQHLVADYTSQTFKIVRGTTEKTLATTDQIPTELGVMDVDGENAIEVTGDANKVVKLKINSNKGNVTFDNNSDGLRASVDLASLVPHIKVNNAGHADNADKLGGQEPSYYAVDNLVIHSSEKGVANGVATLDTNGKVPTSQLPSYVDDVIDGYLFEGTFYYDSAWQEEITPDSGVIYIDRETNKTYRWGGDEVGYVEISASLALGETSATAYAGDKGKALRDEFDTLATIFNTDGNDATIEATSISLHGYEAGVEVQSNFSTTGESVSLSGAVSISTEYGEGDPRKVVEIGSANGKVSIKSDLEVDSSIQIKEPTTGIYGNLAKYNSGVLEIGSTTGAGTRIKGANANGVIIDSDVVQLGSTAVFKANPNKIVEVGRTDYTLQLKGSTAPTWTDGTNTKTVAMTDALDSYLPLSGGRMTGSIDLDSSKLQGTHQGMTRNIAYMDSTDGLHLGEGVLGATIHSHSAPKWTNNQNVTKTLATTDDIPSNVVQYYEATEPNIEEEVFVFYCGSSSKLV